MKRSLRSVTVVAALIAAPLGAQQTQQPVQKHHSVLKGAAVGAIAGHMTHHKHGTLAGAAVGAAVQHHRNAKAAKTTP